MEQKTEQPTQKKKRDSAKKGQIFISRELVSWLLVIGVSSFIFFMIGRDDLMFAFGLFAQTGETMPIADYIRLMVITLFKLVASVIGVSLTCTILPTLLQTRFHLATEAIRIDFNSINPVAGFKKIFSKRTLKEGLKAILYFTGSLFGIALFVYQYHIDIFALPWYNLEQLINKWCELVFVLIFYMLLPVLFVVVIDAFIEFFMYIKELMMTKQEVKQEHKNNEGNPEIKRNRRRIHQELLSSQTKSDIEGSKFILANPTHIAIGIYFNPDVCDVPFISLVERNAKAVAVIKYAEKKTIPVIRNIALARRIFKTAKPYQFIDQDSIVDIIQIIIWLEQIERRWQHNDDTSDQLPLEEQTSDSPQQNEESSDDKQQDKKAGS